MLFIDGFGGAFSAWAGPWQISPGEPSEDCYTAVASGPASVVMHLDDTKTVKVVVPPGRGVRIEVCIPTAEITYV